MTAQATINLKPAMQLATANSTETNSTETVNTKNVVQETLSNHLSGSHAPGAIDWTGQKLGEYDIGHLLGEGGNGQVYAAKHRWLEMPVAIKFLQNINLKDEALVGRFRREAMTSARLIHPNLVRATDGGSTGSQLFLVTELVKGMDLADLAAKVGQLPVPEACQIIFEASKALAFIASKDAIHRDIKPSNIMVDEDGHVKVLDMGLARMNNQSHTMTETGQVMGTIDYMSPEQALDPRHVDFRADMYSLGCTFYFLLTGFAPFNTDDHETLASKLLAHLDADYQPVHQIRADVPRVISELIGHMLAKNPIQRPKDFDAIQRVVGDFAKTADLPSLVQGKKATAESKRAYAWSDKMADDVVYGVRSIIQYFLLFVGILEFRPNTRTGSQNRFQFSFRWVKYFLGFCMMLGVLYFIGFDFLTFLGFRSHPPHVDVW